MNQSEQARGKLTLASTKWVGTETSQRGFSLLEVAVVMVVVGLMLGGMLIPLSAQIEKQDRDETKQILGDMHEALVGYAMTYDRLPCPDTDGNGTENRAGTCTSVEGGWPWVELGVGKEDAWGRQFTYRVTGNFADTGVTSDGTGCLPVTTGVSFSACSNGDISVLDATAGNSVAALVPAIIISHGKNWATTSSVDETQNINGDVTFVDRVYSADASPKFDDLVIWVSPNILKARMLSAGKLP